MNANSIQIYVGPSFLGWEPGSPRARPLVLFGVSTRIAVEVSAYTE
ncbi:MAG: hypothetical protein JWO42_3846 [Chloroflexi bacterium]|nr:hypothetical protein [Chloroflexota bacterium]